MAKNFLNFYECEINIIDSVVYKVPFEDSEKLEKLRFNNDNLTFLRNGAVVFLWRDDLTSALPTFNYQTVNLSFEEHPFIINRMLLDKIKVLFSEKEYSVFLENYSGNCEIVRRKSLLDDDGLKVSRCINVNTYYSSLNGKHRFGYTISTDLKHSFRWNKKDFIDNGIPCEDLRGNENRIHATKQAVNRYLQAKGIEAQYASIVNKENNPSSKYNIINQTSDWIGKRLCNQVNHNIAIKKCSPSSLSYMASEVIKKPKRYYYNDAENTQGLKFYDEQVRILKPYTYDEFNKNINILVVTPKMYEGVVNDFLVKIKENLNNIFHLNNVNFKVVLTTGLKLDNYSKAIYDQGFNNIELSIIIVSEAQVSLSIKSSPYYYCKAKYIGHGIPTQDVKIEKIKRADKTILKDISLNIYAKLGGIPWVVEQSKHLKKEFIVGIGSTVNKDKKAVMGIANIFDFTGKYYVGECIPLTGFDNYAKQLEESILAHLLPRIDNTKEVRLVFHIFKSPSKKYEIKAVENVIQKLGNIDIKYAFVHLAYGHNFRIYYNNGRSAVERGLFINLSDNDVLLSFSEATPLRLTVDKRSNFNDIYYLAKQVYWFAHLSYNSFIPAKKPVTIKYPWNMTKITEKLKEIDGWDYDILKNIGDKLWFI